ncbi:MAG TPA: acetylxylan esterase [Planctomycetota bacterium]|nr:acetylxylan esterase [Planctomycetota bacterium]
MAISTRTARRAAFLGLAFTFLARGAAAERLLLQVEEFDGPWRRQTNIPGYLGSGFCTSNANPKVADTAMRTTATLKEGGTYAVWARGYTSENSERAFQVEVNGTRLAVTHNDKRRRWAWERAGAIELPAGKVAVIIRDADVGFESVDALLLTNEKDDNPMADENHWQTYDGKLPGAASALRFNIEACLALCEARSDAASKADWEGRRKGIAASLQGALGLSPWPERTPLNARVTGRAEREGYTIENTLFESRPGFFVTANVYVPKGGPERKPAVVVVPGHAMPDGKNYTLYRTGQLALVAHGCIVLSYDPIGQGERRLPGYSHTVGYPALLVGWTNEGFITWDTMRAVDCLVSRPDVDPKRLGLTGNSGGGENTFYAMPMEPRFAAGASCCFVCSYHAWVKDGGDHCICNHMPGILRHMEEFEIIALNAPRPFLAANGAKDGIFPIAGTRQTIERARKVYALDDAADRVRLFEAELPHGWAQPMREAACGWLARWLLGKGDGSPLPEPKVEPDDLKCKDLYCLKEGKLPQGARSYANLIRAEAERLVASYPPMPQDPAGRAEWAKALRERLWEVLGGQPTPPQPSARELGKFEWLGHQVERLAISTETSPPLEVPALLIHPTKVKAKAPAVIFLDDGGKAAARVSPVVRGLLERGSAVLALEPRALGEGAVKLNHCASDAVLLGRPLLAQQAWDVLCAARYLKSRADVGSESVAVVARGSVGLIAVLAGALSDDLSAAAVERTLASYVLAIEDPPSQPLWAYAANVLKVADVSQWLALWAPRPLLWADPIGSGRRPLPPEDATKRLAPAVASYRAAGAGQRLSPVAQPPSPAMVIAFLNGDIP